MSTTRVATPLLLPSDLHVIFIGGNSTVDSLRPWLENHRGALPHVALDQDVDGAAQLRGRTAVGYEPRVRALTLGAEVAARFDELRAAELRPDELREAGDTPEAPLLQASALATSALLGSLLHALDLDGFALFVLSPPPAPARYGYRAGYSRSEVAWMRSSDEMGRLVQTSRRTAAPSPAAPGAPAPPTAATRRRSRGGAAADHEVVAAAKKWAVGRGLALQQRIAGAHPSLLESRGTSEALLARVSALSSASPPKGDGADADFFSAWQRAELALAEEAVRGSAASADCLVDLWLAHGDEAAATEAANLWPVSPRPFGFIDLGAGPFRWGPVVGGEGVRTASSLPSARLGVDGGDEAEELTPDEELARLASAVWLLQEHVLAPPSAELRGEVGLYAERVAFQLYVVHNHDAYDPDDPRHLDLAALERELLRLKLPSQSFSFTTHRIAMADEVPLALAYAASLRHAVEPTVHPDGSLDVREGAYLDSRELRAHLRGVTPPPAAATGNWRALPIFVFSVHSAEPLYVDRRYQARALEDMVIAVQSDHTSEPSSFACGADAVTIDLRAPLRPLLAATAHLLGGLLPPHHSSAAAGHRGRTNYLWSVGRSPLSPTAGGAAFAAHQIDAVHRNYVVGALNASAAALRDADGLLRAADAGTAVSAARLQVRKLQERVVAHAAARRWDDAAKLLGALRGAAADLLGAAEASVGGACAA